MFSEQVFPGPSVFQQKPPGTQRIPTLRAHTARRVPGAIPNILLRAAVCSAVDQQPVGGNFVICRGMRVASCVVSAVAIGAVPTSVGVIVIMIAALMQRDELSH